MLRFNIFSDTKLISLLVKLSITNKVFKVKISGVVASEDPCIT